MTRRTTRRTTRSTTDDQNVKHLVSLDFRRARPGAPARQHLRARVALEERHARLPGRVLRLPYRMLVTPTALLAERSLRRAGAAG